LTEENFLEAREHNYLASLFTLSDDDDNVAIAWLDISTGEFNMGSTSYVNLSSELLKISPREIIVTEELSTIPHIARATREYCKTIRPVSYFDNSNATSLLNSQFENRTSYSSGMNLQNNFTSQEISAAGALLNYIIETQKGKLPYLSMPQKSQPEQFMFIDTPTRKSLELVKTLNGGEKRGSLLDIMDKTVTSAGARLMSQQLNNPSTSIDEINRRLDCIEYFIAQEASRANITIIEQLRSLLEQSRDIERSMQRLTLGRGGPLDLYCIAKSIVESEKIFETASKSSSAAAIPKPKYLQEVLSNLNFITNNSTTVSNTAKQSLHKLVHKILQAIKDECTNSVADGNFIKAGFNQELDELNKLKSNDHSTIMESLQDKYRQLTNVSNLKIKHSNMAGYYIEVPNSQQLKMAEYVQQQQMLQQQQQQQLQQQKKVVSATTAKSSPASSSTASQASSSPAIVTNFAMVQATKNSARYITMELKQVQESIVRSQYETLKIEINIFEQLLSELLTFKELIYKAAKSLAELDTFTTLAMIARERDYVRPQFVVNNDGSNNSTILFHIEQGRHAVVELARQKSGSNYYANDCHMNQDEQILLITGPNMAGKSSYLRQNALIAVLAQMGSYVPATSCKLSIVDRLFSRVGASDNLANDQSTFMVEMTETANILAQATRNSMVIMDEVGRGTSTVDGFAIASSILEYLHDTIQCRTLFATHFHELTTQSLANLQRVKCYTFKAQEIGNGSDSTVSDIVFTYKIIPGASDRSFGIHVAKMAGLPAQVIARARQVQLEQQEHQQALLKVNNEKKINKTRTVKE